MRCAALAIHFAAGAWLFIAPARPRSIEDRAPARARVPVATATFDPAAPRIERSRSPSPRGENGVPLGAIAFALACFGAASTKGTTAISRRSALGAALVSVAALPSSASASYALYSASQQSFDERKKTGFVPVATNDRATLQSIQEELD